MTGLAFRSSSKERPPEGTPSRGFSDIDLAKSWIVAFASRSFGAPAPSFAGIGLVGGVSAHYGGVGTGVR